MFAVAFTGTVAGVVVGEVVGASFLGAPLGTALGFLGTRTGSVSIVISIGGGSHVPLRPEVVASGCVVDATVMGAFVDAVTGKVIGAVTGQTVGAVTENTAVGATIGAIVCC